MFTSSLPQRVNEPTRQNNILDLIILIIELRIFVTDKVGDHQLTHFDLRVHNPKASIQLKNILNYIRAIFKGVKEELIRFDYQVLMRNKNTEEYCRTVKYIIATATEEILLTYYRCVALHKCTLCEVIYFPVRFFIM
ncbi:hypothetical protein FHG87_004228 [Trinorchestia longiramus]|nr:hypothetical protein FHG87_004228 [Trinorchestia longiramus]